MDEKRAVVIEKLMAIDREISELVNLCDVQEDVGAVWAAISATASQSAGNRIIELGGNPDRVREAIDKYFLCNPDLWSGSVDSRETP